MKITLNYDMIDRKDIHEAKALQKEYKLHSKKIIHELTRNALRNNKRKIKVDFTTVTVIKILNGMIAYNSDSLTVWFTALVELNPSTIVKINFDGIEAMNCTPYQNNEVECTLQIYSEV